MRRAASTLPVTPAMLRHFAVLTAVATACLAMFASGENGSAGQAVIKAHDAAKARSLNAQPGAMGSGKIVVREIGGLKLAPGTRLDRQQADFEPEITNRAMEGDIRNAGMAMTRPAEFVGPGPGSKPVEMVRDAAGIPAPAVTASLKRPPGSSPPPRRPSRQEYERMMAEADGRSVPEGAGPRE